MSDKSWNAKAVEKQQQDTRDMPSWIFDAYSGHLSANMSAKTDKKK